MENKMGKVILEKNNDGKYTILKEEDLYVVINIKTKKRLTSLLSHWKAINAYNAMGGAAKDLAVVNAKNLS